MAAGATQRQESQQYREHHAEPEHRNEHRARARAARLGGRHLAVVVQPAERQNHGEQQANGDNDGEILHRAEHDELEHHAARIRGFGRAR